MPNYPKMGKYSGKSVGNMASYKGKARGGYNNYQRRLWRDVDRLLDYKRLILKESLESILGKRETRARIEPKGCLSCPLFPVCRGIKNLCSSANKYDLDHLLN